MPKIKQLSLHEAQKIAAGEVVERPAHIVKELIENALDAHATLIRIYLQDGGNGGIRVIDNGCGMDADDAILAVKQYTTSKIISIEDLDTLQTYGFRGEALASIGAVSVLTLSTRSESMNAGTCVVVEHGILKEISPVAHDRGTDITIKDLFAEIPARKKFLKTESTETRLIITIIHAFCLSHVHVHFTLTHGGKEVFNCPPADTRIARAQMVWDHRSHHHLLSLSPVQDSASLHLEGVVSDHQTFRFDRTGVFLFVNNRWIRNQHLMSTVIKSYSNVLPNGKFPWASIHISLPPHFIDVNTHPRKEEVRFLNPRPIESLISHHIKSALENRVAQTLQLISPTNQKKNEFPTLSFNNSLQAVPTEKHFVHAMQQKDLFYSRPLIPSKTSYSSHIPAVTEREHSDFSAFDNKTTMVIIDEKLSLPLHDQIVLPTGSRIIGQLRKTYIILETLEGFVLVDQHAAHERILYEKFNVHFKEVASIALIAPSIVTCTEHMIMTIKDLIPLLQQYGLVIQIVGDTQYAIKGIPPFLKKASHEVIEELVADLKGDFTHEEDMHFGEKIHEKVRAMMACKAAVKAGDELSVHEMEELITHLYQSDNKLTCPHGRPTVLTYLQYDIEKKFKRKK